LRNPLKRLVADPATRFNIFSLHRTNSNRHSSTSILRLAWTINPDQFPFEIPWNCFCNSLCLTDTIGIFCADNNSSMFRHLKMQPLEVQTIHSQNRASELCCPGQDNLGSDRLIRSAILEGSEHVKSQPAQLFDY